MALPTPPNPPVSPFTPLLCVVDFHHARGPEISHWFGTVPAGSDPLEDQEDSSGWGLIPYMALPDGAHRGVEEFSYFSLVYHHNQKNKKKREGDDGREGAGEVAGDGAGDGAGNGGGTSIFGISCCQSIPASSLLWKSEDVTRSAVQKAVVALTDQPERFSKLREKLRVVTRAWFAQRDFRDVEILQVGGLSPFYYFCWVVVWVWVVGVGVVSEVGTGSREEEDGQQYFGLSLREMVYQYKWQMLVLFKCLLLQPKMLFFGSHCERVCQVQFSLLSLIPNLVKNLQDCADPQMNSHAESLRKPDSVRTSDRSSFLAYLGVPLQLFGIGSVFGPYTPLQQLDILTDLDTKSYVVGSTNSLLIQQKDRYCDVLIDLDENLISILSPTLRSAVALSVADRRWIDFLAQQVTDTWDETDPSRPKTHGYAGSEEFIRLQFEEYLLALLSAEKYHQHLSHNNHPNKDRPSSGDPKALLADIEGDPSSDFSPAFLDAWRATENHALWSRTTDTHLFDLVDPRHPCAGGITIEDVQRRLAAQVAELHLDERFSATREVVGKRLVEGKEQVGAAFGRVWADVEALREAQRRRAEEARVQAQAAAGEDGGEGKVGAQALYAGRLPKPDLVQAQASVAAAGQRAGAYLSSWGSWAAEKRKVGWQRQVSGSQVTAPSPEGKLRGTTAVQEGRPKGPAVDQMGKEDAHNGHGTKEAG
ncbi:hypothetical protein LTR91_002396 [Friedmanniomyces endolithicus]|uniref:UDENN domain-containing protein n=1 Tax=Friedmanniomyces endolithicus TaxID=329885 RepID=A0AAN6R0R7_9PEZI|nr:hypothetical protein LTR01_008224 [Friedmanniomyces endolithicus]KAK0829281.1 hypothetical protein LTR73_004225 [Friedmanniomyces endolithicus]KAK0919639.1 hypothetical protein LTR57_010636 [Friedmanniomyces endolithicus]KAK1008477.1 hypothetical protein LTS01_002235 [Friedmanniomyces endolithicus]KAK1010561.1 hypothetical protein LTR91_002396 [Friedmanniomyces endolithicus]